MLPRPDLEAEREKARDGYVFVYDLAAYLGLKPDTLAKRIASLGINMVKFLNEERGRWQSAVRTEDAKCVAESERNKPRIVKPEELFK